MANFPSSTPPIHTYQTTEHLDNMASLGHIACHQSHEAELVAIATKVGTGSSTPSSGTILRGTGSGTSSWSQADLTTDVTGTLPVANGGTGVTSDTGTGAIVKQTSPTITTPSVTTPSISSGGTWTGSPTLSTPTIADFTNSTHNHQNPAGGGQLVASSALTSGSITEGLLGTDSSWVWQSWSPTWGGITIGNATVDSVYAQVGKSIMFRIVVSCGTTTTIPAAADVTFTLPVSSKVSTAYNAYGLGEYYDTSAPNLYPLNVCANGASATTALVQVFGVSGSIIKNLALDTANIAQVGNGDRLSFTGMYEAA